MAHEDYYYKYSDHMPDGTPDTRWQTAPGRWLNRAHDAAANVFVGGMNAWDTASDTYNAAENWLDDKYNAIADWYNPPWERTSNPVTSGGPLSRGDPWERQMGRVSAYFRPGGRWDKEYYAGLVKEKPRTIKTPISEIDPGFFQEPPIGYDAGQVDPGFYQHLPEGYDPYATDPGFGISIDGSMFDTGGTDFTPIMGDALPYTTGIAFPNNPHSDHLFDPNSGGVAAGGTDTRSEWQKWKDSFKKDWAVAK